MNKLIVIVDISSAISDNVGNRDTTVTSGLKLICPIDLVGFQTQQLAQQQAYTLDYSITIPRIRYNNQKYCYFDGQLYEVKSIGKAKLPVNMTLNVSILNDSDISNAIEDWLEE